MKMRMATFKQKHHLIEAIAHTTFVNAQKSKTQAGFDRALRSGLRKAIGVASPVLKKRLDYHKLSKDLLKVLTPPTLFELKRIRK